MPLCFKWMADNLVDHVIGDDHFISSYLKLKHEIDTVLAPYKKVHKDMQKKVKQLNISSFSPTYSYLPSCHSCYII